MELLHDTSTERLIAIFRERFLEHLQQLLLQQHMIVLGVVGGSSVRAFYEAIVSLDIDFSRIHVFLLDERCVPLSSEASNYRLVHDLFASKVPLAQIHAYDSLKQTPHDYFEPLQQLGGRFDIVIASAGEDGHIASLFPHHQSIRDDTKGYITVTDSPKPPMNRISASRPLLERATVAFIVFFGEAKRRAYERFSDDAVSVEACPAKLLKCISTLYVFSDIM